VLVATAGHVDHGKSTLVRALTGVEPDRWAEERRRGLTIDLGFAAFDLPSGAECSFVDVPGHVRFLGNMLAGVAAVDACCFVVAATEGWRAQSEQHLRVLEVLGVRDGVVALTKVDLVDDDDRELARLEIAERLQGSPFRPLDVVPVDATRGAGLDRLRAALDAVACRVSPRPDAGRPRLWVDRSFAVRGAGTVVTGTLLDGRLEVGASLAVGPEGRAVRVRGLQHHGTEVDSVPPGVRTAANLVGVGHRDVRRGDALVDPARWWPAAVVDATLEVFADLGHPVRSRRDHLVHVGSGEHPVVLRVLGAPAIEPGGRGTVRLRLPAALPLAPGDRYVLRDAARQEVVGGGEVLEVDPARPASRARPDRSVDRVVAEWGWIDAVELERRTGERRPATVGRWVVDPAAHAAAVDELRQVLADAGPAGVDVAALDERQRALLAGMDGVVVVAGAARPAAAPDPLADHPWLAALAAAPFAPPPPDGLAPEEVRALVRRGAVVEQDGVHFAPAAVDRAAAEVARLLAGSPAGVTVARVRDVLGTTRRFLLPLLAVLDARGVTRRAGDVRVAGPRLPPAA
jgi:selenocysteine-specific elongation factor